MTTLGKVKSDNETTYSISHIETTLTIYQGNSLFEFTHDCKYLLSLKSQSAHPYVVYMLQTDNGIRISRCHSDLDNYLTQFGLEKVHYIYGCVILGENQGIYLLSTTSIFKINFEIDPKHIFIVEFGNIYKKDHARSYKKIKSSESRKAMLHTLLESYLPDINSKMSEKYLLHNVIDGDSSDAESNNGSELEDSSLELDKKKPIAKKQTVSSKKADKKKTLIIPKCKPEMDHDEPKINTFKPTVTDDKAITYQDSLKQVIANVRASDNRKLTRLIKTIGTSLNCRRGCYISNNDIANIGDNFEIIQNKFSEQLNVKVQILDHGFIIYRE